MWVFLALAAALFFALVHIIDEYCVEMIFEYPWLGVITSALASLVILVPLPFIVPFTGWEWPSTLVIITAVFAGILIQISQLLYFNALANTNAGIVAAYWNMIPAMLPMLSFIFLNKVLTPNQYFGIIILIFASNIMLLSDHNYETRTKAFLLMLGASLIQAISYLLQDFVYENSTYIVGFVSFTMGIICVGILPLALPKIRNVLTQSSNRLLSATKIFLAVEILNLIALAFAQKSIQEGSPSLVAAVETTIPGFTFLISVLCIPFFSMSYDKEIFSDLGRKLSALSMMIVGVYMVS
jgi:drug/metabolite transporter (DMT)-like permease